MTGQPRSIFQYFTTRYDQWGYRPLVEEMGYDVDE